MTNRFRRLAAIACGLIAVSVSPGCQRQARVVAVTPQQRQADIDNNSHIPEAQKEAIKARLANQPALKAQPTPSGTH